MKATIRTIVLSVAGTLVLSWHAEGSSQEPDPATEPDAGVTQEGLHRVDPSIMAAAWVKPDFDLSGYTRIMLMPTAVQFRDVPETSIDARTRAMTEEFPLDDERKEWFRGLWREAVQGRFAREDSHEFFVGVDSNVLVVHGFLVDVVSRIPPIAPGSTYTFAKDPWSAAIVLELRDAATAELVARTIDQRHAEGLLEVGTVWYLTEDLVERWAEVLSERLDQLSDLGGRPREAPEWAQ
ncbi:MAG: hypothetical protein OXQ89_11510 [Rhodospirillaceae bacterium]|nr:hypothetical protein [Rhodospirillaceae bacterium]